MTRLHEEQQPRTCAYCNEQCALRIVLTCVHEVYAYRWLCTKCRERAAAATTIRQELADWPHMLREFERRHGGSR